MRVDGFRAMLRPLAMKTFFLVALTFLAVGSVAWALDFWRRALHTIRTGAPFGVSGHREGAMPINAEFGRVGAVLITAAVTAVSFMFVRIAIQIWRETLG